MSHIIQDIQKLNQVGCRTTREEKIAVRSIDRNITTLAIWRAIKVLIRTASPYTEALFSGFVLDSR